MLPMQMDQDFVLGSTSACMALITQSCPRVGWTRGSGRVGSGRVTILPDFGGSSRVGSGVFFLFFTNYFFVPESNESSNTTFGLNVFPTIFNLYVNKIINK